MFCFINNKSHISFRSRNSTGQRAKILNTLFRINLGGLKIFLYNSWNDFSIISHTNDPLQSASTVNSHHYIENKLADNWAECGVLAIPLAVMRRHETE